MITLFRRCYHYDCFRNYKMRRLLQVIRRSQSWEVIKPEPRVDLVYPKPVILIIAIPYYIE